MSESNIRQLLEKGRLKKLFRMTDDVRTEVFEALYDEDWKVRRNALRFLDHAPVEGMESRIIELLSDEFEEVRKWAAHSLGCDRCKSGEVLAVDPVPHLMTAAEQDPSVEVQRSAVVCLAWNRPQDDRIGAFLKQLLDTATDEKVRSHALSGVARHEVIAA